jgi:hypothetical protein
MSVQIVLARPKRCLAWIPPKRKLSTPSEQRKSALIRVNLRPKKKVSGSEGFFSLFALQTLFVICLLFPVVS